MPSGRHISAEWRRRAIARYWSDEGRARGVPAQPLPRPGR